MLVHFVGIPLFVHFPSFVQNLTTSCPLFAPTLSSFCPCPVCDYIMFTKFLLLSTLSPVFVLLVSFLSSFCQNISLRFSQKSRNKSRTKSGQSIFFDLPPGNPATGQKMDNFRILVNLFFVHLLSWCRTLPILTFYNDIACLDKSWTSSRHCPEHVLSAMV